MATEGSRPVRLNRRRLLGVTAAVWLASLGGGRHGSEIPPPALADGPPEGAAAQLSGGEALQELIEGNARFVAARATHPRQSPARRLEVAGGQRPIAVVLSCSDSRVPPELVFDQGLGDLFVIRVAGNTAGARELGSIEYAVQQLETPLVLVLGHSRCGAVAAAVEAVEKGTVFPGHIQELVAPIRPAVERVRSIPGDLVENAVRANVETVVGQLQSVMPVLAPLVAAGSLVITGGRYDLDTGRVDLIPWAVRSRILGEEPGR